MATNNASPLASLIEFGRKWVDNEDKAEISRAALIDGLIAAGYTYANTAAYTLKAVRENLVSNENKVHRDQLLLICAASVKIKGKRLSEADLAKFVDAEVSHNALLSGAPKGGTGVSWNGTASSRLGKVRLELEARENAAKDKVAGTPRTPSSDADIILTYLQKAYTKTFKDSVDLKCDLQDLQKELRSVAQTLGGTLKAPNRA